MDCSIIICTYNQAENLKQALAAVLKQKYARDKLEVLIIDNRSTDRTRQVVESFINNGDYPVRYVYEPKPGLSHARNRGIREARGEIVIFIDDDALPKNEHWAANIVNVYSDPQVCAAGGDLEPSWPKGKKPQWLSNFLLPPLGIADFGLSKVTELHYPVYPWGANISYRKKSVREAGGFLTELGWSSNGTMISGEETELNLRLEKAGKKIVYVPNAAVLHVISEKKLTESWFMKRAFAQGLSDAAIDIKYVSKPHLVFTFFRKLANVVAHLGGMVVFSLLRERKSKLFCRYNMRFAAGYVFRVLRK